MRRWVRTRNYTGESSRIFSLDGPQERSSRIPFDNTSTLSIWVSPSTRPRSPRHIELITVQLHNTLIMEIISSVTISEPDIISPDTIIPVSKRRRVHPYQGAEYGNETLHSARLKSWIVSMSKAERHNFRSIGQFAEGYPRPLQERILKDETNSEGALVEPRRDGEPRVLFKPSLVLTRQLGFVVILDSQHLCASERFLPNPSIILHRVKRIAQMHGLQLPQFTSHTTFGILFNTALEEFLTNIIRETFTTVTASDMYDSVRPQYPSKPQHIKGRHRVVVRPPDLATTLYLMPNLVPYHSPAVQRLTMSSFVWPDEELEDEGEVKDQKEKKHMYLNNTSAADFYRLMRASRSGTSEVLQDFLWA